MTNRTYETYQQLSDDYRVIEQALHYLADNYRSQPDLAQAAARVGYSEYHFQRLFARWVGISPKRFLQFLTKEHARRLLDESASLLETSYQSGLSGSGRLHDLFVACEAVTPGEYKSRGEGMQVRYGFHPSPFGECLVAATERGVCGLSFVAQGGREELLDDLRQRWEKAELIEDAQATQALVGRIFPVDPAEIGTHSAPLHLLLNGTNFQIKVWEALLRIPPGKVVSYQQIAAAVGKPGAARAVGQAVGANPIAYLIPCHRVIRQMGVISGYRWGVARKQAILGWEFSSFASRQGEAL
jgi:AraC family transcriptional regulator of adaptative response/methylated-DNA-[protein]-cysteine methyltransferase